MITILKLDSYRDIAEGAQLKLVERKGGDVVLSRPFPDGSRQMLHLYRVTWIEDACCSECGHETRKQKEDYCLAEDAQGALEQCSDTSKNPRLGSAERIPFKIRGWGSTEF